MKRLKRILKIEVFTYHLFKMILGNKCSGSLIKKGYFLSDKFHKDLLRALREKSWWEPLWYKHNFLIQNK